MTRPNERARRALGTQHDDAGESPGFRLWQVATTWQRSIRDALAPIGLTHAQFVLLASATWLGGAQEAPVTQAMLSDHAKTDAVMTSEVLRTLEKKKLITRHAHPDDKRARSIEVTPAGRALAKRAVAAVEKADAAFFSDPSPELAAFISLVTAAPATGTPRRSG